MEIVISNVKDFSKKQQTIIIRNNGICLIDGNSCYEKVLSKDIEFITSVESKLSKIMFEWKEEYVGNRAIDGEKYNIILDINHKKRKYKIQNKFPSNWEEFLEIKQEIMGENDYD